MDFESSFTEPAPLQNSKDYYNQTLKKNQKNPELAIFPIDEEDSVRSSFRPSEQNSQHIRQSIDSKGHVNEQREIMEERGFMSSATLKDPGNRLEEVKAEAELDVELNVTPIQRDSVEPESAAIAKEIENYQMDALKAYF